MHKEFWWGNLKAEDRLGYKAVNERLLQIQKKVIAGLDRP
jgi:hypothetical protein